MSKTTYFYPKRTLRTERGLLDLSTPKVMGILNATPDSFFAASRAEQAETALQRVSEMIQDGADIIDIGGMSSRPGATLISPETEMERVLPLLEAIREKYTDILISIDTVYAKTALAALQTGADIINDISAGSIDPELPIVAADKKCPYILMHMQGTPDTMQKEPVYADVTKEVFASFRTQVFRLQELGVEQIILDPGFGFGKNLHHNYQLAAQFDMFTHFGLPLLAGVSRKRMICALLQVTPEHALNGSTALHMHLLMQGANILRVHDVREAVETIHIFTALQENTAAHH
ncbi:MAG: dihydropteroate synthase [Chitinophagales bacterium]